MAKSNVPAVKPKTNTSVGQVVDYGKFANRGFEDTTSDDYLIPFLKVLQSNSPEVEADSPKRMKDAKVGMLLNSATQELMDGDKGIIVVPCMREHSYVEWIPRTKGGGIVGRHAVDSDVVKKAKSKGAFGKILLDNGNELIETFYLYCMVLDSADAIEPSGRVVVSFTSTKIKKYKRFRSSVSSVKGKPPMFSFIMKLTSVPDQNAKGKFRNFELVPINGKAEDSMIPTELDGKDHPLLVQGNEFVELIEQGVAKADTSKEGRDDDGEDDSKSY
jgi:hypothetical protein